MRYIPIYLSVRALGFKSLEQNISILFIVRVHRSVLETETRMVALASSAVHIWVLVVVVAWRVHSSLPLGIDSSYGEPILASSWANLLLPAH